MSTVVTIDGKNFVAGCHWQAKEDMPTHAKLFEEAAGLECTWAAQNTKDDITQIAFASDIPDTFASKMGLSKYFAIAKTMASVHKAPWIGKYQIDTDNWWFIAIGDGGFVFPDGDICGSKDEINRLYERHVEDGGWLETIEEGVFNDIIDAVKENQAKDLMQFVNISPKADKLRKLTYILAALIVVAPISIHHFYTKYKIHQEMIVAMSIAKRIAMEDKPKVSEAMQYGDPSSFLNECENTIHNFDTENEGWKLTSIDCGAKSIILTWDRIDGSTTYKMRPPGLLSSDLKKDIQQISRKETKDTNNDFKKTQIELQQSYLDLLDQLSKIGISTAQNQPPFDLGDKSGSRQDVDFIMDFPPIDIIDVLKGIKGCRVTDVILDLPTNKWKVKVSIFSTSLVEVDSKK